MHIYIIYINEYIFLVYRYKNIYTYIYIIYYINKAANNLHTKTFFQCINSMHIEKTYVKAKK